MSAHTPGPWKLVPTPESSNQDYVVRTTRDRIPVNYLEDATLIAAAPDLLAALKAVMAIADRKTDEFDMARAAIIKAEGR